MLFTEKKPEPIIPGAAPYPIFNPETGQWINVGMGMYQYPGPFFPAPHMVRPDLFPNAVMPYSNYPYNSYRGRFPRGRGRGAFRGRGGYNPYSGGYKNGYDDYEDTYDHKRRRDYHRR